MLDSLTAQNDHRKICDFEDHMDSAHTEPNAGDFLNGYVDEIIRNYVANNAVN
jgi:hypothetical protein